MLFRGHTFSFQGRYLLLAFFRPFQHKHGCWGQSPAELVNVTWFKWGGKFWKCSHEIGRKYPIYGFSPFRPKWWDRKGQKRKGRTWNFWGRVNLILQMKFCCLHWRSLTPGCCMIFSSTSAGWGGKLIPVSTVVLLSRVASCWEERLIWMKRNFLHHHSGFPSFPETIPF